MKDKKKIIICAVVAVLVVVGIVVGVLLVKRNSDPNTDTESNKTSAVDTQAENTDTSASETDKAFVFPSVFGYHSVMSLKNIGVVYDSEGLRIIDEKTEKAIKTFSDEYEPLAFDGNTLYIEKSILDTNVKVNPEYMYGSAGDYIEGWDDYYVGEIMKYTISDDKLESVVKTNKSLNEVLYFDENCMYYVDIPEDQIGYYGDYDPYGGNRNLIKYSFETKTSEVVREELGPFESDVYRQGSDTYVVVESYPSIVIDIENDKIYELKDIGQIDRIKDGKIIYSEIDSESGKLINEENYEYEYPMTIKQCNIDGSGVETLKTLTINELSGFSAGGYPDRYIYCGCKVTYSDRTEHTVTVSYDDYRFYDTETGEMIEVYNSMSEFFEFNGEWFKLRDVKENNTRYIDKVNADGTADTVCDAPEKLSVEWHGENLSSNGFYYFEHSETGDDEGQWIFVKQPLNLN